MGRIVVEDGVSRQTWKIQAIKEDQGVLVPIYEMDTGQAQRWITYFGGTAHRWVMLINGRQLTESQQQTLA